MEWEMTADRPIYRQIIERMETRIVSGFYPPGAKLPSVRDLAQEASVNPNTMQKALAEMEQRGLVMTMRTAGRLITEDANMIDALRLELAKEQIHQFIDRMRQLGYTTGQMVSLLREMEEDET